MKPTVLLFNLSPAAQSAAEVLCREIGAEARVIAPAQQGQTLGALLGLLPESGGTEIVPGEMLVMAYFEKGMLDAFLSLWKQRQIPSVPRKAMLTLTNTTWTGLQLYEHLSQEMAAMAATLKKP